MPSTELYGTYAHLLSTEGRTPITNETNVVFVGAAKCDDGEGAYLGVANEPVFISSEKDYADIFGGAVGDGWSLSEAVEAAFRVCNLKGIWVINVNDEDDGAAEFAAEANVTAAALLGDASLETGVYAIQKMYPDNGKIANIACIPVFHTAVGTTKVDLINALKANVTKANGHWDGVVVYDVSEDAGQINASSIAIPANVVSVKDVSDERAIASWGKVITSMSSGTVTRAISGAAVKACLYAQTDAQQVGKLPSRSIGNLYLSACLGFCIAPSGSYSNPISMSEANATALSADGITSFLNRGGGRFYTWGDHTSAFSAGSVADERARFDVNIRMLLHLTNRFQQIWGDVIDTQMDMGLRNDILHEENEHLAYCLGCRALIGNPKCVFSADNTVGTAQKGEFYFKDLATVTPPFKYADLGVAFTSDGFSVYLEG